MNRNLPFDQFTVEQLAGDLLPNPTHDQIIATGFHRNTLTNDEGGTDREEFRTAAVVDRVNTTMQVWMGLTMACAQCHDHKYDPLRQEEYYQLFAIFNQTEDADRGDNSPNLTLSAPGQEKQRDQLQAANCRAGPPAIPHRPAARRGPAEVGEGRQHATSCPRKSLPSWPWRRRSAPMPSEPS